jgi:hypothetical protein
MEKYGTASQAADGNITGRMRIAGWVTKATDTHSECVILIGFAQQQWVRERVSMLSLYVHCIIVYTFLAFTVMIVRTQTEFTEMYSSRFMETLRNQTGIIVIASRPLHCLKTFRSIMTVLRVMVLLAAPTVVLFLNLYPANVENCVI